MTWLIFALLTGAALLAVIAPLAFGKLETDPEAADKAFYADQIAEIDRERLEGRLAEADAEAARREAARRLLRAGARRAGEPHAARSRVLRIGAALAALVAIPALAVPLYMKIGAVDLPDMPLAERLANTPLHSTLDAAIARIEAHLAEHPDDGRGFEVIAPYYLRNGRIEEAVRALAEALRLLGPTAERHDALGEALVAKSEGRVAQDAQGNFEAALKIAPADPMARYYMGLAAAQAGDARKAKEIWTKLLDDAPPQAAYRQIVSRQLQSLDDEAPNGAEGRAIAAMPEKDRAATIGAMVDRLAGRLAQKGEDTEGWLKLIRAYSVLGQNDKAGGAVESARKALAGKTADLERIEALARELGVKEAARP
jgi:cytochrome c-type biogenesis protein CcmH